MIAALAQLKERGAKREAIGGEAPRLDAELLGAAAETSKASFAGRGICPPRVEVEARGVTDDAIEVEAGIVAQRDDAHEEELGDGLAHLEAAHIERGRGGDLELEEGHARSFTRGG